DRDELRDAQAQQRQDRVLQVVRVGGGVRARDPDLRAAAEVDAADVVDGQRGDMVDVALHDPLEAVADAEDGDSLERAADGRGPDDAVDSRCGPAPYEDGERAVLAHVAPSRPKGGVSGPGGEGGRRGAGSAAESAGGSAADPGRLAARGRTRSRSRTDGGPRATSRAAGRGRAVAGHPGQRPLRRDEPVALE